MISSVSLTVRVSRAINGNAPSTVTMHRIQTPWSEGEALAVGGEGDGAAAAPGDPTWQDASHTNTPWSTPGGDHAAAPSAALLLTADAVPQTFRDPQLIGDVEAWVGGAPNHGWILIGEERTAPTAKRLDASEHPTPAQRPVLEVVYEIP